MLSERQRKTDKMRRKIEDRVKTQNKLLEIKKQHDLEQKNTPNGISDSLDAAEKFKKYHQDF